MRNRIFIPLTFDRTGKRFYGEGTYIKAGIVCLLFVTCMGGLLNRWWTTRYVSLITGSVVFLIVSQLFNLWLWLWIARKWVMKEKILKKIFSEERKHRITDIGAFWGIYSISGDKIYFVDGRCGILVTTSRGYLHGRPPNFEDTHYSMLTMFIRHVLRAGYSIKYYNRMESDANIEALRVTEQRIASQRGTGLYELTTSVIRYLRMLAPSIADTEKETFFICCDNIEMYPKMLSEVKIALEYLKGGLYTDVVICTEKGIYNFIQSYFGLSYINIKSLIRNTFKEASYEMVKLVEFIYTDSDLTEKSRIINGEISGIGRADAKQPIEESEDEDTRLRAEYEALQRAQEERQYKEYLAKTNFILASKGIDLTKFSENKLKKMRAKITPEEMEAATEELNRIRKARSNASKGAGKVSASNYKQAMLQPLKADIRASEQVSNRSIKEIQTVTDEDYL